MESRIAAGFIREAVDNRVYEFSWPRNSVAVLPFRMQDTELMKLISKKVIEMQPITYFFPNYDHSRSREARRTIVHIQNGIGDIWAFSSVAKFLDHLPMQIHVTKKFHPLFDWYERRDVQLRDYYQSIATDYNATNRLTKYQYWRRLGLENATKQYGTGNWFEAHYKRLNIDTTPEGFDRPRLRTDRVWPQASHIDAQHSVLICHRSSCQMRSSKLEDFYWPVKNALPGYHVYVHASDLTDEDLQFCRRHRSITVIPPTDLQQLLLNAYDATIVVSTDSQALHFREGIGRPALGVFGAMTAASRCSGYLYTRAFDVRTGCPHQPCVIHENKKGEVCTNANPGDLVARCQSGPDFQQQLYQELKAMR